MNVKILFWSLNSCLGNCRSHPLQYIASNWVSIDLNFYTLLLFAIYFHQWIRLNVTGMPIVEAPKKISGVHKRCWKYIASLPRLGESKTSAEVQTSWLQRNLSCWFFLANLISWFKEFWGVPFIGELYKSTHKKTIAWLIWLC